MMNLTGMVEGGFLARLAIDLVCVFVLVRLIYYRTYRRADLFLTFFAFNVAIFLISFVLNSTEMSMGAAFGLFAVFSMLRYRTEGISTTDMTYLFLGIALGLITAVARAEPAVLAIIGALIVVVALALESGLMRRRELRQEVIYDDLRLLGAGMRAELIADLVRRTGLNVHRIDIEEIDLVRDSARLAVYHYAKADAPAGASAPGPDIAGPRDAAPEDETPRRTSHIG
jgi:Domain of unknown function (DUF4956)